MEYIGHRANVVRTGLFCERSKIMGCAETALLIVGGMLAVVAVSGWLAYMSEKWIDNRYRRM